MYSLDINFLHDRPEYRPDAANRSKTQAVSAESRRPLILGAIAAVALPGIVLGLLLFLQQRNADLEQQQAVLDSQLGNLAAQQKELAGINQQVQQTNEETNALAGVFNQIKPWSAMMQDIRDRIPPGVQILKIEQLAPDKAAAAATAAQPSPSPSASPQPNAAPAAPATGIIQISGLANSFNDVNDFMLVLQKSNFLKAADTQLISSELAPEATLQTLNLPNVPQAVLGSGQKPPKLPRQVQFQIQTALSDVPASELLRELDRKGAAGLVTRIEDLQRKGVIQQP